MHGDHPHKSWPTSRGGRLGLLLYGLLACVPANGAAGGASVNWAIKAGGSGADDVTDVAEDGSGGALYAREDTNSRPYLFATCL